MKKIIAKMLLVIVVVAGVSSSAAANPKLRKGEVKFDYPRQSLMDLDGFERRHFDVKYIIDLIASLMSPIDIDGPVERSADSKTKQ